LFFLQQGSYRSGKILESPGILLLRIQGLESPGKRHKSWKTMEIPGKSWNSEAALLDFFLFLIRVVAKQIVISNTF